MGGRRDPIACNTGTEPAALWHETERVQVNIQSVGILRVKMLVTGHYPTKCLTIQQKSYVTA